MVLGLLLTSCSEYSAEQKLKYCADTEYSKEMASPIQVYLYITDGKWSNEFEKDFIIANETGFPLDKLVEHLTDLLSKKDL